MPYLGNQPFEQYSETKTQVLTGNGTVGPYTLDYEVGSVGDVEVFVNNVRQQGGSSYAYTVSGNQLTMTGAVASTDDFYVVFQGKSTPSGQIPEKQSNGDYTFDNGTLFVDASANKVGIGDVTPTQTLDVAGGIGMNNTWFTMGGNNILFSDSTFGTILQSHPTSNFIAFRDSSGVEKFRVRGAGGVTFNGDTAAVNALDDYEEGTWDPSVGGTATYTDRYGKFQKVGNIVHVQFKIEINNIGTGSANILSGFPFTSANLGQVQTGCVSFYGSLAQNVTWVAFYIENNATTAQFVSEDGTADPHLANGAAIFGNAATLFGAASYFVS